MILQKDIFSRASDLEKRGRTAEALDVLRDGLRCGRLDAEGIDRAGRMARRMILDGTTAAPPLRVLILGQCTTSWLVNAVTAVAWGRGVPAMVSEGGYDNILQDLDILSPGEGRPDIVALLPWSARLLAGGQPAEERIGVELAFWQQAWEAIRGRSGSRILQIGYDWVVPGAAGHSLAGRRDGEVGLVREMNAALREHLPAGGYFLDLEQASGMVGRASFYDMRRDYWTKQPFSEAGVCTLAEHLWAGVRALTSGPKKVLVLDLDNTLWGGVVGEVGPLGIAVGEGADGEAFRGFQRHVKNLADRGVVLAVASKNNPEDAREPFGANPDMVLKLDDFGAFEASWEPKGVTIARIAESLNLGLDSFVFFDDNPAEREQVRRGLPEVEVPEVPEDPAEFARALQAGLWFEATDLTREDRERAGQYAVERERREARQSYGTLDDYLRSLGMKADVRPVDDADLPRVVQLLSKTNQFNLTTRRHTRENLLGLIGRDRSIPLTFRMADRFGDYGLVGVVIGVPLADDPDRVVIDTWLMSCRVIGRTFERFMFGEFLGRCRELGYRGIIGEYTPTRKNGLVADLYERLGFGRLAPSGGDEMVRHALEVEGSARPETFVESMESARATP